jgi:hypothetical protein
MCINSSYCKIVWVYSEKEQRQNSKEDSEHENKSKREHPRRLRARWE